MFLFYRLWQQRHIKVVTLALEFYFHSTTLVVLSFFPFTKSIFLPTQVLILSLLDIFPLLESFPDHFFQPYSEIFVFSNISNQRSIHCSDFFSSFVTEIRFFLRTQNTKSIIISGKSIMIAHLEYWKSLMGVPASPGPVNYRILWFYP